MPRKRRLAPGEEAPPAEETEDPAQAVPAGAAIPAEAPPEAVEFPVQEQPAEVPAL